MEFWFLSTLLDADVKGKKLSLCEFNNLSESGTREKDPVDPTGKMNFSTLILADNRSGQ